MENAKDAEATSQKPVSRSVAKAGLASNLCDGTARSHSLRRSLGRKKLAAQATGDTFLNSQFTWGKLILAAIIIWNAKATREL